MSNQTKPNYEQARRLIILLLVCSVISQAVFAAPQGRLMGELWVTGAATVNGKNATTGMTVLSGNRIQTAQNGVAVVNLSNLGRVAVQTETDFLLEFKENSIKGNLNTGTVILNIPNGVMVNILTPNGEVTVPVEKTPATLTVSVTLDGTHAIIKQDQNRARSFLPFEPASRPANNWLLSLFALGGAGIGAALTAAFTSSSSSFTIIPTPPDVTTIVP